MNPGICKKRKKPPFEFRYLGDISKGDSHSITISCNGPVNT